MTEWTLGSSLLFCPADRPERYGKALAAADTVIIDLEDAVAAANRPEARKALVGNPVDPARVIVRVNPRTTADYDEDMRALAQTEYRVIMLAKTESAQQVEDAAPYQVLALCETARGVLASAEVVRAPNVVGVMWGAEDLMASLGGSGSRLPDGTYRDIARFAKSTVLLNAAVAGVPAIDTVFLDVGNVPALTAEADEAVACGFVAKACIHPSQAAVVRQAFQPSADEVAWARRVVAGSADSAVFLLDGQMIDAPLVAQARQILRRAEG
ncbi:citrate lyase subunit beta [Parafrankia colletiae]|uniref:Citrate lyase subunit beta n=1 Tax=Parafrankia colletiae TaxID=573497 RepID=A0A1S1QIH9_9ACTN|nr:CoA ester lyase [Parafrankia colletiae]MCK9902918.1 CoA ester lyase [Frankia sp. Cpl3]OHV33045.1 citrate lyase subunit beta [Parafrankia colletiae]